jgi:hypothetical protein
MNNIGSGAQIISERSFAAHHFTFDTEAALPLLQRMLFLVRRSRETPLQFEIDSHGIAAAALDEFGGGSLFQHGRLAQDLGILNELIHQVLGGEDEPPTADVRSTSGPAPFGQCPAGVHSIAAWLEQLYRVTRAIHPQAIDVLALRLQGFEPRDIAERLDLGGKLVQRVLSEVQAEWTQAEVN